MGLANCITAFPVLARILQERGLTKTALGSTAITCAAVDDVTAWSILAFVVAIVRYVANDAYPAQAPFGWIALWEHCQSYSGEMPADLRPISEHVRGSILRNIRECPDPFLMGGLHIQ